jgi:hypothetical protein
MAASDRQGPDNTGLGEPDVFYFGNAIGEAGDNAINTIVNATDEIVARNHQQSPIDPAAINNPYDYNRDGLVNSTDQIIARENQTNPLTMLRLIQTPAIDEAIQQTADLDWLYEFEQMETKNRKETKSSAIEAAVDRLLATEGR